MISTERPIRMTRDPSYRAILAIFAVYSALMTLIPAARLAPGPPVQLAVLAAGLLLYSVRAIPDAVGRWIYYILLTGSYQALRFAVSSYSGMYHGTDVMAAERALFGGTIPSAALQQALYAGATSWYDYVLAVLHASLFAFPIALPAILLARRGAEAMKRSTVALVLLSCAGYLTYVLFPLTPPWISSLEGDLQGVDRVVFKALREIAGSWLTTAFQPCPRAAMPSLHAGLPFMVLLIALREFGRRAWWISLPVAGIWFAIVYGAEHYVIDLIAGVAYGAAAFLAVYGTSGRGTADGRHP